MRCENGARAGPFGGVVPVQLVDNNNNAAAGGGNNTAAAAAAGTGRGNAKLRARQALARRVRESGMRFENLKRRAVSLAEDLGDPDVLAEIMEDYE